MGLDTKSAIALIAGATIEALALGMGASTAETMKQEPPPGALPCGKTVRVDDETCGSGKIKEKSKRSPADAIWLAGL